jgi:hypothetical protein
MFSTAAASTSVRVTTYNILSSKLARKDHFQACKEEDLKPYVRYQRIVRKLEAEVKKNAVICLQEVRMLLLAAKKLPLVRLRTLSASIQTLSKAMCCSAGQALAYLKSIVRSAALRGKLWHTSSRSHAARGWPSMKPSGPAA